MWFVPTLWQQGPGAISNYNFLPNSVRDIEVTGL